MARKEAAQVQEVRAFVLGDKAPILSKMPSLRQPQRYGRSAGLPLAALHFSKALKTMAIFIQMRRCSASVNSCGCGPRSSLPAQLSS